MANDEMVQRVVITKAEWNRMARDYRTGDPRKGTAKVLRLTDKGTALVPVLVVNDPPA